MSQGNAAGIRLVLPAVLMSGAAALIYEVVWTRALSLILGSTTYAVSTMLATFMAGLALGAWMGGRWADRVDNPLRLFGLCELGIGVLGIVSLPLIWALPRLYLGLYRTFHLYPALFFALQIALCASVMLLPTTLMGATFPLVSRAITRRLEEVGRKVGSAYSFNTVGAVIGSLAAGFLLVPTLGLRGAVLIAGLVNLGVGLLVLRAARPGSIAPLLVLAGLFLPAAAWTLQARPVDTLFNFYSAYRFLDEPIPFAGIVARDQEGLDTLFEGEYAEGSVRALRTDRGNLLLQVAGKIEGTGARDMDSMLLMAYLPIAAHREPRSLLVIGLGAGVTLAAAKGNVTRVDLVEIHPGVLEAVSQFGPPGVLDGVGVVRNDARNYLLTTPQRWDLIASQPSYPTEATVGNLFTREFFALVAQRLEPGGIFGQWLPYYLLANDDVSMMIKTFASVFPHAALWKAEDSLDLILLGSDRPFSTDARAIARRVTDLNRSGWPLDFVLSRSPAEITEIAARTDVPINTDDHPILEFRIVRNLRVGDLTLVEPPGADPDGQDRAPRRPREDS
jgi:spermidine synthase